MYIGYGLLREGTQAKGQRSLGTFSGIHLLLTCGFHPVRVIGNIRNNVSEIHISFVTKFQVQFREAALGSSSTFGLTH